ncbi:MAG: hypothetical protein ACJZ8O_08860 [Pirellulaceae bacterium]
MSEEFNPYRVWLGIPLDEQPPNHYRLLGLALFEQDPDVIENAANRQMAHIRTFQSGPNAATSQQILNELSEARLCLLKTDTKNSYDAQLQAQIEPLTTSDSPPLVDLTAYSAAPEAQLDTQLPTASNLTPPPIAAANPIPKPTIRTRSRRSAASGRHQSSSGTGILLIVGLTLGVAALIIVLFFLMEQS